MVPCPGAITERTMSDEKKLTKVMVIPGDPWVERLGYNRYQVIQAADDDVSASIRGPVRSTSSEATEAWEKLAAKLNEGYRAGRSAGRRQMEAAVRIADTLADERLGDMYVAEEKAAIAECKRQKAEAELAAVASACAHRCSGGEDLVMEIEAICNRMDRAHAEAERLKPDAKTHRSMLAWWRGYETDIEGAVIDIDHILDKPHKAPGVIVDLHAEIERLRKALGQFIDPETGHLWTCGGACDEDCVVTRAALDGPSEEETE
jgi:hypothetical protein